MGYVCLFSKIWPCYLSFWCFLLSPNYSQLPKCFSYIKELMILLFFVLLPPFLWKGSRWPMKGKMYSQGVRIGSHAFMASKFKHCGIQVERRLVMVKKENFNEHHQPVSLTEFFTSMPLLIRYQYAAAASPSSFFPFSFSIGFFPGQKINGS